MSNTIKNYAELYLLERLVDIIISNKLPETIYTDDYSGDYGMGYTIRCIGKFSVSIFRRRILLNIGNYYIKDYIMIKKTWNNRHEFKRLKTFAKLNFLQSSKVETLSSESLLAFADVISGK